MSNLKTFTSFAIATLMATLTFAQEAESDKIPDLLLDASADDFVTSDLDQDGQLNMDEFISFVVMRADDREERFEDIVIGGEYNLTFKGYDKDASGGVDLVELRLKSDMMPKHEDSPGENAADPDYPQ